MKKPTQKQLALEYGLSVATLCNYLKDGIDIYNKQQVLDYAQSQNLCNANEDKDLQLLTLAEMDDSEEVPPSASALQLKLEKLRHETSIKERQSELLKLELEERKGDLISLTEVCESNTEIASKIRSQLKTLSVSLPPQLEGLDVRTMSKKIDSAVQEVLEYLYQELKIKEPND